MNRRNTGFALAGIVVLLILIFFARYALREAPPAPNTAQIETAKPEPLRRARPATHPAELPGGAPASRPDELTVANAATLYRQAFVLYDALSEDEKRLLGDWRTNADASVEAELCEKIRPICDIMHEAASVTSCDWGIEPVTFQTPLPFLASARACARTAAWSASHCRSTDSSRATGDLLSALRLGQQVSQTAIIGCLVDRAIQGIVFSSAASNLNSLRGADGQRLAAAIADPAYGQAPARAMEQEANATARLGDWLASLPSEGFEKEMASLGGLGVGHAPKIDQAAARDAILEIADLERQMAEALASSTDAEFQTLLSNAKKLEQSNPLARFFLPAVFGSSLERVHSAAVSREIMLAALAVVDRGTTALSSHPDPATGQPFIYTETADGFELQSGYQTTNGVPLTMQLKQDCRLTCRKAPQRRAIPVLRGTLAKRRRRC